MKNGIKSIQTAGYNGASIVPCFENAQHRYAQHHQMKESNNFSKVMDLVTPRVYAHYRPLMIINLWESHAITHFFGSPEMIFMEMIRAISRSRTAFFDTYPQIITDSNIDSGHQFLTSNLLRIMQ